MEALTRIIADRSDGALFFGNYYQMDYELMGGDARAAIVAESAKLGTKPFLPPVVPFGSRQWPMRITPGLDPLPSLTFHKRIGRLISVSALIRLEKSPAIGAVGTRHGAKLATSSVGFLCGRAKGTCQMENVGSQFLSLRQSDEFKVTASFTGYRAG
jgi:hypothetical protein